MANVARLFGECVYVREKSAYHKQLEQHWYLFVVGRQWGWLVGASLLGSDRMAHF